MLARCTCVASYVCDGCFESTFEKLKPRAIALGHGLADLLEKQIVAESSWLEIVTETHPSVTRRMEPMSEDPRMRARLARSCAIAARERLKMMFGRSPVG